MLNVLTYRTAGAADAAAEVERAPVSRPDWRSFDGGAFTSTTPPPAAPAANRAPTRSRYTAGGGSVAADDTILGVAGKLYVVEAGWWTLDVFGGPLSVAAGDTLHLALAVKASDLAGKMRLGVLLNDVASNNRVELDFAAGTVDWFETFDAGYFAGTPSTSADGFNRISPDLGTDEYIVEMRLAFTAAYSGDFSLNLQSPSVDAGGDRFSAATIHVGTSPFVHDAGDGREKVLLPQSPTRDEITMTAHANQRATVTAPATRLVLPPSPGVGTVGDHGLRVTVDGGSLVLPGEGASLLGDPGPFTSRALISVRAYDDGTYDLVARGS
jgi:hypothetical protein